MISAKDFLANKNKRITLLGMSGVGKTHLAKLIGEEGGWFHFSEPDVRTLAPLRFFWHHELRSRFGRLAANDDRHEPLVRPQKNAGDGGGHGRVCCRRDWHTIFPGLVYRGY